MISRGLNNLVKSEYVSQYVASRILEKNCISSIAFVLIIYFVLTDDLYLYNYISEINMFKLNASFRYDTGGYSTAGSSIYR